jgi:hypothetical protein
MHRRTLKKGAKPAAASQSASAAQQSTVLPEEVEVAIKVGERRRAEGAATANAIRAYFNLPRLSKERRPDPLTLAQKNEKNARARKGRHGRLPQPQSLGGTMLSATSNTNGTNAKSQRSRSTDE